ncbi:hypothetical protein SAMN05216203_2748 [Marinobacter daqiaonensis]|uniref:Aminomethyltransferase folate-binding domain-containing protein n=1 Tax=Marinobacter daqiaonensis TaxID=650891 RepID=A0A1I6J7L1_9GAMM|nr:hypothetical protein [Marinobacter daqiaonensis]SFR74958.1 hypothetical protein SAMN05216203_2748 [Marinobacter daqiaonensis]
MSAMPDNTALAHSRLELPAVVFLTDRKIYRVSGPGTDQFLQGQVSQSLDKVTAGHAPRAAISTPKGRAYLLTRLVRDREDVLLSMPAAIADGVTTQLNKYLMLFRGTVMTHLDTAELVGLLGRQAAVAVAGSPESLPAESNDSVAVEGGFLIRTTPAEDGTERFELWLPDGCPERLRAVLSGLRQASTDDWLATEIAAGIAELSPETQEAWVPQMLNWQHLEGIHFKKGCYTGQEVIARMHYLGQLKKSLFRLSAKTSEIPAPGTGILGTGKSVGEVVQAVGLDDGSVQLLAVLRHSAAGETLTLAENGAELTIRPLPYAVPERETEENSGPDT